MNLYKKSFFIKITLLFLILCACDSFRFAGKRPVLEVPDGNKDRMKKTLFAGTPQNPKYWLSRMTVVSKTFDGGDLGFVFPGYQHNVKAGYFEFQREQMIFCNRVNRKFLEDEHTGKQVLCDKVYAWDIEHSDFRLAENDGYTTNREEENNYISWDKKAYFKTKLNQSNLNAEMPYINSFCWNLKKVSLDDNSRTIENEYISFIVKATYELNKRCRSLKRYNDQNFTATVGYKYSFKRTSDPLKPDPHYTPYKLTGENDPLRDKYGYFLTLRPDFKSDNRDKYIFYMNRWNPNKKHIFYFTKDYPEKYKYIAHGVICNTNKMFAKHGLSDYPLDGACRPDGSVLPKKEETCSKGICFELKNNSGQELGDIRYSFFHMTDIPIKPLGYGPSNANPATGEVVNGTVVIGTRFLDYSIDRAIEYFKEQEQRYKISPVLVSISQTLDIAENHLEKAPPDDRTRWVKSSLPLSQNRDIFNKFVSFFHFADPNRSNFTLSSLNNHNSNGLNEKSLLKNLLSSTLSAKKRFKPNENDMPFLETAYENLMNDENHILVDNFSLDFTDPTQGTFYPLESIKNSIYSMAAKGLSKADMKEKVLFNVIAHEFGHVLNLRHNFYGSVDEKHHHEHAETSSVMDYMNLKEEMMGPAQAFFGSYDTAALVYAYSGGKIDLSEKTKSNFLFCTDEDVSLNFLCQMFDYGTTFSEVTQSLIERYDEAYIFRNFRDDRAYWGERYYIYYIINTMRNIKRPLGLLDDFNKRKEEMSAFASEQEIEYLEKDLKQAVKLSLSFYNSIIQLDDIDREWFSKYNSVSGSLEKIGVLWDKMFATLFLMSDFSISENPNDPVFYTSYIPYMDDPDLKKLIEIVMENTLTQRIDTIPGFTTFSQITYAQTANTFFNRIEHPEALEKIGVRCYTPEGLKNRFDVDPYNENEEIESAFTINITPSLKDPYYKKLLSTDPYQNYIEKNLKLGAIYRHGVYYTSLSELNAYSFSIIDNLIKTNPEPEDIRYSEESMYDLYLFYNLSKNSNLSSLECDSGDQ